MSEGVRQRRPLQTDGNVVHEKPKQPAKSISWKRALCVSFISCIVALPVIIYLLPSPIEPVAYSMPDPPSFEGPLAPNDHLQKADRLYENKILGPESLVIDGDHLYTGTDDGKIVDIHKGTIRTIAKLGRDPCGRFEDEPTCGRPLGMKLDHEGYLIVVDSYLGLFKVNVATGDVYLLWPSTAPINGKVPRFLNDLYIMPDGLIYITESSTKWQWRHNRFNLLEGNNTGRLISYDPKTNITTELATGFAFANGIQLTRNGDALLICETTTARIMKYNLIGPNAGKVEVFADNLPGLPDNIRRSSSGGYWVGFAVIRRKEQFSLIDFTAPRPWLRKLVTKFLSQESIMRFIPKYGLIAEFNDKGEIVRSLHDSTGTKVPDISEVEDHDGVLFLGSYGLPYLSKLYLQRIKN
ncbi:hypothetical protein CHS0354_032579 [Potamilus streckersoni]|uniref:Strictosidine synthase conserved region domain-containing protein n=1 Tax=Potamilus streckersoni TaxID=2493646 RepID=A0AAE0SQP0_9BIVA|nr:hypothetical protein CHS0354_032579 [Potamilus streckersoni]